MLTVLQRLVTNIHKYDHSQPVLKYFHWLPVKRRVAFEVLLITYKLVHGLGPSSCIRELAQLKQSGRRQRSDSLVLWRIPKTKLKSYGGAAFCVVRPNRWRHLPEHIRYVSAIGSLKFKLKTYLFVILFDVIY